MSAKQVKPIQNVPEVKPVVENPKVTDPKVNEPVIPDPKQPDPKDPNPNQPETPVPPVNPKGDVGAEMSKKFSTKKQEEIVTGLSDMVNGKTKLSKIQQKEASDFLLALKDVLIERGVGKKDKELINEVVSARVEYVQSKRKNP